MRLVAVPEGALQGFNDEVLDLDHVTYARECAIDIPGPETDELGAPGAEVGRVHHGPGQGAPPGVPRPLLQRRLRHRPGRRGHPEAPQAGDALPVEHSVTPHDVWDRWIELYGATLDAFFPVADTEIGRLGVMMANEGSYPENARGLAMNGAEVVYRASFPHRAERRLRDPDPGARARQQLLRRRAQPGDLLPDAEPTTPIDTFGGHSMIVDYKGRIVGQHPYGGGSSYVAGTIDIEALRHFRANAQWDNWMKDLTTEMYQLIYEEPIYPKNLYPDRAPYNHDEYRREVIEPQMRMLQERGIYAAPDAPAPAPALGRGARRRSSWTGRRQRPESRPWGRCRHDHAARHHDSALSGAPAPAAGPEQGRAADRPDPRAR